MGLRRISPVPLATEQPRAPRTIRPCPRILLPRFRQQKPPASLPHPYPFTAREVNLWEIHRKPAGNPDHKRSRLVGLTALGRSTVEDSNRLELEFLNKRKYTVGQKEMLAVADTLRQVREMMESEEWRQAIEGNLRKLQ